MTNNNYKMVCSELGNVWIYNLILKNDKNIVAYGTVNLENKIEISIYNKIGSEKGQINKEIIKKFIEYVISTKFTPKPQIKIYYNILEDKEFKIDDYNLPILDTQIIT